MNLTTPSWAKRLVGFDTETTGTGPDARIVEFGICVWDAGRKIVSYGWTINPGEIDLKDPAVVKAFEVNRIDPACLKDSPTYAESFEMIRHSLEQADVRVAHNATFDQRMLRQEFQRAVAQGKLKAEDASGFGHKYWTLDTLALDFMLLPEAKGHKLLDVATRWGVREPWQQHRAAGDAHAAVLILDKLAYRLPSTLDEIVAKQKLAQQAWQKRIAEWQASKK